MKAKAEEQRINLNDLLKKAKNQKREERKTNIKIVSGVVAIGVLILIILSI